jgi:hypothetical protein
MKVSSKSVIMKVASPSSMNNSVKRSLALPFETTSTRKSFPSAALPSIKSEKFLVIFIMKRGEKSPFKKQLHSASIMKNFSVSSEEAAKTLISVLKADCTTPIPHSTRGCNIGKLFSPLGSRVMIENMFQSSTLSTDSTRTR